MTIKEYINSEKIKSEFKNDLKSLIEIPSVVAEPEGIYPYGKNCAAALDKAMEIANRIGLKTENHEYHCASAIYGEGDTEIGIIAHLDVVPAGNGWEYEPYSLTDDKGLYIGRGTLDDKGPCLTAMYAVRYLKENNIKLPFAIRIIMGSDEEVGSTDLEYFKSVRKPPVFSFTPDAAFPVCVGEKGILGIAVDFGKLDSSITEISAGTVTNAVPGDAYAVVNGKKIEVSGRTAHASTPETGINAIGLLIDELEKQNLISEADKNKFDFLKKAATDYKGGMLGINYSDDMFGYLTCVESVLRLKGGHLIQSYNIRFPMSKNIDEVYAIAEKAIISAGFKVLQHGGSNGYYKAPESKEIKSLTNAFEEVMGEKAEPYTMGGGTYARSMPGAVAFGMECHKYEGLLGEGRGNCHDRDEYISKEIVDKSIEIFVKALLNLAENY